MPQPILPKGLRWMTPEDVVEGLRKVLPRGRELWLSQDGAPSGFPTVKWLTLLYQYLRSAVRNGEDWSKETFGDIPLIPDQEGRLHLPGYTSTPLLTRAEDADVLGPALLAFGVPVVSNIPALRKALKAFTAVVPDLIWPLTGPDLVDTLGALGRNTFPEFQAETHFPLLDYLASPQWKEDHWRDRPETLADLRSLPIFPTADGRVVDLQGEIFMPGNYELLECVGSVTLLQCGHSNAWAKLLELAGVSGLNRAEFIQKHLLPKHPTLKDADKLKALRWLRDNFSRAQTELEDEEDLRESLREALEMAELIRCEDGEYRPACEVYDPESELVHELLGDGVPFPDRKHFERGWKSWMEFFRTLGLVSQPGARDLLTYIEQLCKDAESGVSSQVGDRLLQMLQHLNDHWAELSRQPVGDQDDEDLASALEKMAWLPAERSAKTLGQWPGARWPDDRLYQPGELYLQEKANLVCSQHPIFAGIRIRQEVQNGLGFATEVSLQTALDHFDCLLALWESSDPPKLNSFHQAIHAIYRYLADYIESTEATMIAARYAGISCIWDGKRLWQPEHTFRAKCPYFGGRRATIPSAPVPIYPVYELLGVRETPSLDDYLAYLDQLQEEFGTDPLPESEVSLLLEVYRRIGEEYPSENGCDRTFPLLTENRVLLDPDDAFYDDAPWFRDRIRDPRVNRLFRGLPVAITRLRWVRSLARDVEESPTSDRDPISKPEVTRRVADLEALIRSSEFRSGVARIVYDQRQVIRPKTAWLSNIRVIALQALTSELIVRLDDEKTVIGSGPANYYYDHQENQLLLNGNSGKLLGLFLAEAINTGMADDQLQNLSPLVTILDCEPAEIDAILTQLRVKPMDDESAFAPPQGDDHWPDPRDEAPETWGHSDEREAPIGELADHDAEAESTYPGRTEDAAGTAQTRRDSSQGKRRKDRGNRVDSVQDPVDASHSPQDSPTADGSDQGNQASSDTSTVADPAEASGHRAQTPNWNTIADPRSGVSPPGDSANGSRSPESRTPFTGTPNSDRSPANILETPAQQESPSGEQPTPPTSSGQSSEASGFPQETTRKRRSRRRRELKQRNQDRMATYVAFGSEGQTDGPAPPLSDTERMERIVLGDAAAELVCVFERAHGRNPIKLPHNYPGWDIDSFDIPRVESEMSAEPGSSSRIIEVKGIRGPWTQRGVAISRRQFEAAQEYKERYWLYVVEFADDPSQARIHPIPNPCSRITRFWFDRGWRQLADSQEAPSAGCSFVAGLRIAVLNVGEGVVERVEEQGSLRVVHVRLDDGTRVRKPYDPKGMRPLEKSD